jgi:acyl-CoA thioesterase FadM
MYLPGESAVVESLAFKFRKPVYDGRLLVYRVVVTRLLGALQVVRLRLTVESDGQLCIEGEAQCLLRKTK